jgi:hypothetical protein
VDVLHQAMVNCKTLLQSGSSYEIKTSIFVGGGGGISFLIRNGRRALNSKGDALRTSDKIVDCVLLNCESV